MAEADFLRRPMPRPGNVLGLVGTNGIGKSTALKILSGKLKPNLGRYDNPPDWEDVIKYFRGSELQNYFTKLLEDDLTSVVKPQYVDQLPRALKGPDKTVSALLNKQKQLDNMDEVLDELELRHIYEREVPKLSGGELQRFAIGLTCVSQIFGPSPPGVLMLTTFPCRFKTRTSTCLMSLLRTSMSSSVWPPLG